ncbi:MAG TPA: nucleotidyl transferase AbiEii/AbiGii toxin family protein [Steroidobacteraceae bacterium]|jgi:hypothetical protein
MYPDFKELLSAFNAHHVKYLVVGGYAVSLHAQPRATKDLDLLISSDAQNSRAVYAALAQFGAPVEGLSAQDFTSPGSFFRMGTPPMMVDIFPSIGGVDFQEAWQRRVNVAIDDNLTAPFISRDDLLAAKLSAGRPQDLADVAALRDAEKQRETDRTQALASASDDETRKRAREDWLKMRQQNAGLTTEEARAEAREQWLGLREQQGKEAPDSSQTGTKRGSGLEFDEDTES